jgi:hypothetical protein
MQKDYKKIIDQFCKTTSKKVGIVDEYGEIDWRLLEPEKQKCIEKIASIMGVSSRFINSMFLKSEQLESSGASRDVLVSQMGQYLRFALYKTNKDYVSISQYLIKLYFEDLDNYLAKARTPHLFFKI